MSEEKSLKDSIYEIKSFSHAPPLPEKRISGNILGKKETILLVDDKEMVLEIGKKMLEYLRYRVIVAARGEEAVERFRKNADKINLIILDMIVPDMTVSEMFWRLKEIRQEIKIMISSGYNAEYQADNLLGLEVNGFIQKPYSLKTLSRKIREVLD